MAHNLVSECPSDSADTKIAACDLLLFALPEGHGLEVWKELHGDQTLNDLPVAILTVQNQEIVRLLDWSKGRNCQKDFGQERFVAQLKKLLQIAQSSDPLNAPLVTGQFVIDPFSYRVTHAGKQSTLSVLEFRLLYYLATRPNRFFTRKQLRAAAAR